MGNPNWVKGQSGNPKGRPKGTKLLGPVLRRVLEEAGAKTGQPNYELVARKLVTLAIAGELDAIKVVLDRVDGRVTEHLDHTSDGEPFRTFTLAIRETDGDRDG